MQINMHWGVQRDALNGWARNVGVAASNEACPVLHDTDEECSLGSPMDTPASSEPCMDIDMEVDAIYDPPCAQSPSLATRSMPACLAPVLGALSRAMHGRMA